MLVLSRRSGESVILTLEDGRAITVNVLVWDRSKVRLGIDAPKTVTVHRDEVQEKIRAGAAR